MKIKKVALKNFKRFTDLTIDLSAGPQPPKLVLLIGTNGCGKSGVFDAFEVAARFSISREMGVGPASYYLKNKSGGEVSILPDGGEEFTYQLTESNISSTAKEFSPNSFYGRSAVRYLPRITRTTIGQKIDIEKNSDKPNYYIDADNRFENDIDALIVTIVESFFKSINLSSTEQLEKVKAFLNRINEALPRIFGEEDSTSLRFISLSPPSEGQPSKLLFEKGGSKQINYDLLSSGEKEVINILFNLFVRTPAFQDTIYFFDEIDAHLHTSLQFNLLKEIVENWIPENCQLWTASHSLGFIQYAKSAPNAVIIDFDNFDFDKPIVLEPFQGQEVFDIAVPKEALEILFKDLVKVFCENQNAILFNSIGLPGFLFLREADKSSVFLRVEQDPDAYGIIDRDYLTDAEMERICIKFPHLAILQYYCFENYLYHPNNLQAFDANFRVVEYIQRITTEKNKRKNEFISKLRNDRSSYIFFKKGEYKFADKDLTALFAMLESDDFEVFYQVFSMKSNGHLCGIHDIGKKHFELVKTSWFQTEISTLLHRTHRF